MKKKNIVIALLVLIMLFSGPFTSRTSVSAHTHSWTIINGGYTPPSHYYHEFWCNHSDGTSYYERCYVTTNSYTYTQRCTSCGTTETITRHTYSHGSPHCNGH